MENIDLFYMRNIPLSDDIVQFAVYWYDKEKHDISIV